MGSRRNLRIDGARLALVRTIIELVEARRRGRKYVQSPRISPASRPRRLGGAWPPGPSSPACRATCRDVLGCGRRLVLTVTLFVPQARVMPLVDHLRALGGGALAVLPAQYLFDARCEAYERLLATLGGA